MALLSQAKKSERGTVQPSSEQLVGKVGCQNHCQKPVYHPIRRLEKKDRKDTHTHKQTQIDI